MVAWSQVLGQNIAWGECVAEESCSSLTALEGRGRKSRQRAQHYRGTDEGPASSSWASLPAFPQPPNIWPPAADQVLKTWRLPLALILRLSCARFL